MKRHFINIVLLCSILFLTQSCSNNNPPDLSFSGIEIGRQFPDSLLISGGFKLNGNQRLVNNFLPEYEGQLTFSLPSHKDIPLNVKAYGDHESGHIFEINIDGMNLSQMEEFYDMLIAKYGDPQTVYNETENTNKRFGSIILDVYRRVIEDEKNNIYSYKPIKIAEWEPIGYESKIQISCYSYVFTKDAWSDIQITYYNDANRIKNLKKYEDELKREESHKKWKQKHKAQEEYKKKNKETMDQDF